MKEKITKEEFSFHGYFSSYYGLGPQPEMMPANGFSTTDYNLWPPFAQTILVLLMFVGGCSGSTAGSIKCGRILLLLRSSTRSLLRLSHPRAVRVVKLDGKVVDEETLRTVSSFFLCFFALLGVGCLVVSLDGYSLTTSFTAALGCLSNVGPGLDLVGPMGNFGLLSGFNKVFLSLLMLIGRLEILISGNSCIKENVGISWCYYSQNRNKHKRNKLRF